MSALLHLEDYLFDWYASRHLIICDVDAPVIDPICFTSGFPSSLTILVSSEGVFSETEREYFSQQYLLRDCFLFSAPCVLTQRRSLQSVFFRLFLRIGKVPC